MTQFDLSSYLDRIGLDAAPEPTADGLATLQTAQLRAIAFENIDPFLGRVPDLEPGAIFDKAVRAGRGGYCYELNGLFADAMTALGFRPERRLARVRMRGVLDGPRSHLTHVVRIDDTVFIADTGFGGNGPLLPVRLSPEPQADQTGTFRVIDDTPTGETVLERATGDGWHQLFAFDAARVTEGDIAGANQLSATWERAPFPAHLMVARYTDRGRIGLFDRDMTGEDGSRTWIEDRNALTETLKETFRLALSDEVLDAIWDRLSAQD